MSKTLRGRPEKEKHFFSTPFRRRRRCRKNFLNERVVGIINLMVGEKSWKRILLMDNVNEWIYYVIIFYFGSFFSSYWFHLDRTLICKTIERNYIYLSYINIKFLFLCVKKSTELLLQYSLLGNNCAIYKTYKYILY